MGYNETKMVKVRLRNMVNRRGDEFAQSAIAFPMVVLLIMALFNLSLAGFASVNAANAANHGARVGSVYQQHSSGAAYSAAMESISYAPVGSYQVSVSGGGFPGGGFPGGTNGATDSATPSSAVSGRPRQTSTTAGATPSARGAA